MDEHPGRKLRLKRYYADRRSLIVTIPTSMHEVMHHDLLLRICYQLYDQNLHLEWQPMQSTTFPTQSRDRGGGQGDSSGGPGSRIGGAWPTLVIEAGYSQSLAALRQQMRWWFDISDHQVKIVVLVKIYLGQGQINIEKYQEEQRQPRAGATLTRAAAALTPYLDQNITIVRHGESADSLTSYTVTRGALRLDFERLFRRQPMGEERDIVITEEQLQQYAAGIWR